MAERSSKTTAVDASRPLPFAWQFTAGAVAGILEIVCMYPLDIVKTRFQLNSSKSSVSSPTGGIWSTLQHIVRQEGWSHLYRGILAPIMVEAPKRATKFAANDFYTKQLQSLFRSDTGQPQPAAAQQQKVAVLAGIGAGMSEALVVASFDVVKIRMQDPTKLGVYRSSFHCFQEILAREGVGAFTQGLEATIWRHGAWNGGYFGVIFAVKDWLTDLAQSGQTAVANPTVRNLLAGTIGGIVGTVCNTPFDVVKTRIQSQQLRGIDSHATIKYRYALPGLVTVVRDEGFFALYKGFLPKVLRLGPGGGILLVVYEAVLSFIRKNVAV